MGALKHKDIVDQFSGMEDNLELSCMCANLHSTVYDDNI